jgi:hypothetical protein
MTKLSLRQEHIEQARKQSVVDQKPWLLVLQEHGDEAFVLMPFKWFVEELHPYYSRKDRWMDMDAMKDALGPLGV